LLDARKCLEIYDFCQQQYVKLEKKNKGIYSPKHDKIVMELAAKKFQMSETIINKAFDLAQQTLSKNSKTKSEKIIRDKLIQKLI
jgi:LAS superfamily LD-carboxypeptidase LdcB